MAEDTLFCFSSSISRRGVGAISDDAMQNSLDLNITRILSRKLVLRNRWTASGLKEESAEERNRDAIQCLSYSNDGKTLVAGSANQNIYMFDPNTGKARGSIAKAHKTAVSCTQVIQDNLLVSGSEDSSILLWDMRKSNAPLNALQGHSSCISELTYSCKDEMLLSSSLDNTVRYWHLPTFMACQDNQVADNEDNVLYRGLLTNCPNITQIGLSHNGECFAVANATGSLFIVHNLDILGLSRILMNIPLDDGVVIRLAWFFPNCSLNRKNRIRVLKGNEYVPSHLGEVSKILGLIFHPMHCMILMRATVSNVFGTSTSEQSCALNLVQTPFDSSWLTLNSFGSEVMEETLMYMKEEEKHGLRTKKYSFSKCGRIFSNPGKTNVKLQAFSKDLDDPYSRIIERSSPTAGLFEMLSTSSSTCKAFVDVGEIQIPKQVLCAKFSPTDFLLAVGDDAGSVYFHQPSL